MSQTIYFGTYTKKESKGIYKAQFDPETGTLNHLELVAAEPNPTYIAFSEKATSTVSELKREKEESQALQLIFSRSITSLKREHHSAMSLSMTSVNWSMEPTITKAKFSYIS